MKKEEHLKAWLLGALMLEVFTATTAIYQSYTCIVYKPGYPAYDVDRCLRQDISLGLCLLPVIAGVRRGTPAEKVAARLLAVLPLIYIFITVLTELPACLMLLGL